MSDELKDKPCGALYCPLVDENRFFVEAQETLMAGDRQSLYRYLGITRRTWCQGHAARGMAGKPGRCRPALARVAAILARAKGENRAGLLPALLKKELEAREREDFKFQPGRRDELIKGGMPF